MNEELKRLLELAAKAASIEIGKWIEVGCHSGFIVDHNIRPNGICWNPLTDDGDALRLAVKLEIDVQFIILFKSDKPAVRAKKFSGYAVDEQCDTDTCAATRLAIVRAAAAIGEAMP